MLPRRAVGRIARRPCGAAHPARSVFRTAALRGDRGEHRARPATRLGAAQADGKAGGGRTPRSEEHTSELQSLMRISYAVFCLKQKKVHEHHTSNTSNSLQ